jgi:hypothetical protein
MNVSGIPEEAVHFIRSMVAANLLPEDAVPLVADMARKAWDTEPGQDTYFFAGVFRSSYQWLRTNVAGPPRRTVQEAYLDSVNLAMQAIQSRLAFDRHYLDDNIDDLLVDCAAILLWLKTPTRPAPARLHAMGCDFVHHHYQNVPQTLEETIAAVKAVRTRLRRRRKEIDRDGR